MAETVAAVLLMLLWFAHGAMFAAMKEPSLEYPAWDPIHMVFAWDNAMRHMADDHNRITRNLNDWAQQRGERTW